MQRLLALQCRKHDLVLCLAVCPVDAPQKVKPTIQLLQGMRAVTQHSSSCRAALRPECRAHADTAMCLLLLLLRRRLLRLLLVGLLITGTWCTLWRLWLPLLLLLLLLLCLVVLLTSSKDHHLQGCCIRLQLLQLPPECNNNNTQIIGV